tara:strand:- start:414 stop:680 length:267 start_codon:yes stop_codon:yes gene_type:complete
MNEHQEKHLELTLKHNKRVNSIRENRLPKCCVDAIDDAIKSMNDIHESIIDGVAYGYNPLSIEDVIKLAQAARKLQSEFTVREVPKYD